MEIAAGAAAVLKWLDEHGIWSMLTFFAAGFISIYIRTWYRRRIPQFSVHVTHYFDTGHPLYKNVFVFELRNLRDHPVVVLNPNFRFTKRLKAGTNAHGNSATGDYEIKFRLLDENGNLAEERSWTATLLRHRQAVMAYMPIDEALTQDMLLSKAKDHVLAHLYMDVVLLKDPHPRVYAMSIPIRKTEPAPHAPPLGGDGHPKLRDAKPRVQEGAQSAAVTQAPSPPPQNDSVAERRPLAPGEA